MYSCRADSSTTTHTATSAAAAAAADMESSGYSYDYSFNDNQGLFHSPVLNQRFSAAVGVAAGVIGGGGGDSDHRGGVYRMDPHLTCLKLGKRRDLEKSFAVNGGVGASSATAAPVPKCQVDGCEAALVRAKEYHRRHKVCEVHAKAAAVVVVGVEKRFCQQCSRFHLVSEFDDSKRSCRSRLAGHNKRRRKNSNVSTAAAASTWRAPSLLSSTTNTNAPSIVLPSDLSSRSSAALRELIDEHRASTILAGNHRDRDYWPERQVTLDLMQGTRLVTNAINSNAKEDELCFGLWNSFI